LEATGLDPVGQYHIHGEPKDFRRNDLRRSGLVGSSWPRGSSVTGLLTVQDRMSGPQPVPYTGFNEHGANKNVSEMFGRRNTIEGALKGPAQVAGRHDDAAQNGNDESCVQI
jgi:hypothetical protein